MIACLGWGSLVWKLEDLLVEKLRSDLPVPPWTRCAEGKVGDWQCDGPPVKVEFLRQSKDKRLTLVLHASAAPVPSLWARMTVDNLNTAVKDLKKREETTEENIGRWSRGQADPKNIPGLVVWAISRDIKHVIWTKLEPKFKNQLHPLTKDQAVAYLSELPDAERVKAEEYVRQTPQQIDTAYRRYIVRCLGPEWEVESVVRRLPIDK